MARRDRNKPAHVVQGTELCTVQRLNGKPIQKGTVLVKDGAWQRKYVVEYIKYVGVLTSKWGTGKYHTWAVGIRNLGEFYADGRVYLARRSRIVELTHQQSITDTDFNAYSGICGGYLPVEPAPQPEPLVLKSTPPCFELQGETTKFKPPGYQVPGPDVQTTAILISKKDPPTPAPTVSPEAILDQFIIK